MTLSMYCLRAPRVLVGGRWWHDGQVAALARSWHAAIEARVRAAGAPVAAALPASHEGVALFLSLAGHPAPIVLLSPDRTAWPSHRPELSDIPLFLPPTLAGRAADAASLGFRPVVLPEVEAHVATETTFEVRTPGVVLFTSGSTGEARPVFRSVRAIAAGGVSRATALGLGRGDGLVCGVPLTSAQGTTMMLTAMQMEGPLGLLAPLDHRAALATLALPDFALWWATPHFADVLGRCALTAPARVPRVCVISSPVSRAVFDAFLERFGVPLRQVFSSTETGPIAGEQAPDADVQFGSVGHTLPGVSVHVGETPAAPAAPDDVGRVWVRSPFLLEGYGVPPSVVLRESVDGWWPTRDLARRDADGRLWLAGRVDQNIRTRDGRLVNLAEVEARLQGIPGVRRAAVVTLADAPGVTFGAVVECQEADDAVVSPARLGALPAWARPRRVVPVETLPTLPNGKVDRRACAALVGGMNPA